MDEKITAINPFYRIITGGSQKDFPIREKERALKFLSEQLKTWTYASINKIYKFIKKENE